MQVLGEGGGAEQVDPEEGGGVVGDFGQGECTADCYG